MPTHFPPRNVAPSSTNRADIHYTNSRDEWRCGCGKLLGVRRDGRMHVRFGHSHEYLVGFPVVATCRSCGTLNQTAAPAR
jgi:hypothetical protein